MKYLIITIFVFSQVLTQAQELYFPPSTIAGDWETSDLESLGWCADRVDALDSFMVESNSKGLIILKDGKIALERYYNGHSQDSVWYWASAAKSLTAFEIGLLQEDGLIDIDAPSSSYLGEGWTSCTPDQELAITVKNQLTMTTGLDYGVSNIDCTDPSCLQYLGPPDSEWFYHNAPYTLLSSVIENVTGSSHTLNTFNTLGLAVGLVGAWIPLGDNNVFFSNTRAMARFGLLMNARGEWDGSTIMSDKNYFEEMISTSQDINQGYGYLWWLNSGPTYRLPGSTITFNGKLMPDAPDHLYMAIGKNGQIIMVDSITNTVIVRVGDNPDLSLVPVSYTRTLWDEVQKVICTTTSIDEVTPTLDVRLYPNPVFNNLFIDAEFDFDKASITDTSGKLYMSSTRKWINVSDLAEGFYILTLQTEDRVVSHKFYKH